MKHALVVRGGWEGHAPAAATDRYVPVLKEAGFDVTVADSLDSYLDAERLAATDLIVQCWTMGTITGEQAAAPDMAGVVMPATWTRRWGAGRVNAAAIGHQLPDLEVPEVDSMIRAGMAWAAR